MRSLAVQGEGIGSLPGQGNWVDPPPEQGKGGGSLPEQEPIEGGEAVG